MRRLRTHTAVAVRTWLYFEVQYSSPGFVTLCEVDSTYVRTFVSGKHFNHKESLASLQRRRGEVKVEGTVTSHDSRQGNQEIRSMSSGHVGGWGYEAQGGQYQQHAGHASAYREGGSSSARPAAQSGGGGGRGGDGGGGGGRQFNGGTTPTPTTSSQSRTAIVFAQKKSAGSFAECDGHFGNFILPVIPRLPEAKQ
jgi:hypothetical protein